VSAREKRLIYHFTHVDNVPSILAAGELACDSGAPEAGLATEVGAPEIKRRRRSVRVPTSPGGAVGDYVPFYFAPSSPMMYRIACDRRDGIPGRYQGGTRPLVYVVSSVARVLDSRLRWVASDGNCASTVTTYTASEADLDSHVDWDLMDATFWNATPQDADRQRRRMAELLVHRRFPLDAALGFAVSDESMALRVRETMDITGRSVRFVEVRPHWYYLDVEEANT
jgi:ssDNA thymidine ADP-ribosyltransferase, DarT